MSTTSVFAPIFSFVIHCLLAFLLGASADSQTCPAECECDWSFNKMKCSNITDIPANIPSANISVIDFSTNNISSIEHGSLSYLTNILSLKLDKNLISKLHNNSFMGMVNLTKLDLSKNVIIIIEEGSFKGLANLVSLDLSYNHITALDGIWLKDMLSLSALVASYNKIEAITHRAFVGLNDLKNLDLRNNELRTLDSMTFVGDSDYLQLKWLYLSQNNFIQIPSNAFGNLKHLQNLVLSHLPYLELVDQDAFAGLENLKQIHLSNNKKLVNIDRNAFPVVPRLRYVYFENNSIETFHYELLPWKRLQIADLRFNPLQCDCQLKWMSVTNLLKTTNTTHTYANRLNCSGPPDLLSKFVLSLPSSSFGCPGREDDMSNIIKAVVASSVAVAALVTFTLLVRYRHVIRSAFIQKYKRHFDDSTDIDISDWKIENETDTFIPTETVDEIKV